MKRLGLLLFLFVAASSACTVRVVHAPETAATVKTSEGAKPGGTLKAVVAPDKALHGWVVIPSAVNFAAASTDYIVYDTTQGGTVRQRANYVDRIPVSVRCNQAVTLKYQTLATSSSTWRTRNGYSGAAPSGSCVETTGLGSGLGFTVPASTDVYCDFLVQGPDSRIVVTTGGTPPTSCEVDVRLNFTPDLSM